MARPGTVGEDDGESLYVDIVDEKKSWKVLLCGQA